MENKPLKRHPALIALSKDHHFGLLLGFKIRNGLKKGISIGRINAYILYFFEEHLKPHFKIEENYIFTCLPENDPLRTKAEQQHQELYEMVDKMRKKAAEQLVQVFEQKLVGHIRFEERQLFEMLQKALSETELQALQKKVKQVHEDKAEEWADQFWV